MDKENVNTIKYPSSLDAKLEKIAVALGLSKRALFIKMVEYFYRTKKDPDDTNDELLKNALVKSHKAYTSFIKAQEQLLLIPMKDSMDRMISNQKDIVKYFNEQVVNSNKAILKNQQEQLAKFQAMEQIILKSSEEQEKLKAGFLQILNAYIKNREEIGAFKTREKEELADQARKQVIKL